jgi:hypothetical protein
VLARPLSDHEREVVGDWIETDAEAVLFWAQSVADQRHGMVCALAVAETAPDRRDLIRAALFHDVGKQQAGLGVMARTLAGACIKLRVRVRGRLADHVEHGEWGGRMLSAAGAEDLVVSFARHHHGRRPPSIEVPDWELLQAADRVRAAWPGRLAKP